MLSDKENLGRLVGKVRVKVSTREAGDVAGKDANGKNIYKFPAVRQNVTFDFTACSDEQIRELLTSTSPVVRYQAFAREKGTGWMQVNVEYTFDVAAECSGKRAVADPSRAIMRAAAKMSKEALAAKIAELEKMYAEK
jgi:hypothetical protein